MGAVLCLRARTRTPAGRHRLSPDRRGRHLRGGCGIRWRDGRGLVGLVRPGALGGVRRRTPRTFSAGWWRDPAAPLSQAPQVAPGSARRSGQCAGRKAGAAARGPVGGGRCCYDGHQRARCVRDRAGGPFHDPDPFHELRFASPIAARRAIAEEIRLPLAKLSDDDRAFIDALLAKTTARPEILAAVRERFPQGRRGGVG